MINSSLKRSFLIGLQHAGPISQLAKSNSLVIRSLATQSIEKLTEKYKQLGRLAESTKHPGEKDNALRFQAQTLEQIKKQGGASAAYSATKPLPEDNYSSSYGSGSYSRTRGKIHIPLAIKLLLGLPLALMAYEIADDIYEDSSPHVKIERAIKRGFPANAVFDLEKVALEKKREQLALKIANHLVSPHKDRNAETSTFYIEKTLKYISSPKKEELMAKGVSLFLKEKIPVLAYRLAIEMPASEKKTQLLVEVAHALLEEEKKRPNSLILSIYIPNIIKEMSPGKEKDEVSIALAYQEIALEHNQSALKTIINLPPSEKKERALLDISQILLAKKETSLAYSFLIKMAPSEKKDLALLEISNAFEQKEEYFYAKRAILEIRPGTLKDKRALDLALKLMPKKNYGSSQELINSMLPSEEKEQAILDFANLLIEKNEYKSASDVLSYMKPSEKKLEAHRNLKVPVGPVGPLIPVIAGLFMACAFTLSQK